MIVWKVVIERVTVIKFRMDNGGGNGAGCFEVEIWADIAKFTNVIVAGFRKCRDLVREGKVFIKDKAKVASRVGCSERRVVNFRNCRVLPLGEFTVTISQPHATLCKVQSPDEINVVIVPHCRV